MYDLILRWLRAIFGLSYETLRMIRRESAANVRHLLMIPQDVLLRWYSEECPGTSKCKTLFMLGEDAGSCLRIISNDGNKYNRALMGYVLQSHVRALVVTDPVGRVMCRSLIRLVLRSDTLTPVIFCDPMFFTVGYSRELQRDLLEQARWLEEAAIRPEPGGLSTHQPTSSRQPMSELRTLRAHTSSDHALDCRLCPKMLNTLPKQGRRTPNPQPGTRLHAPSRSRHGAAIGRCKIVIYTLTPITPRLCPTPAPPSSRAASHRQPDRRLKVGATVLRDLKRSALATWVQLGQRRRGASARVRANGMMYYTALYQPCTQPRRRAARRLTCFSDMQLENTSQVVISSHSSTTHHTHTDVRRQKNQKITENART